ncbi:ABC transporter ATP-binding protein [Pseudomonas fluorescens]|jgi:iron(III) transport system ATP-binding protein|uniref:ABC transporter ATP-binding protein n=1 Tax=Pseudomonas fluorescens TaxID=294 RepID=UPI0019122495|nr:ABC transporter ATP-binding protein [Pseudomonas fluorescens]
MSQIHLHNLQKSFGQFQALKGIDLKVEDGTLLALLGPSGCGKSTTLQLLAGFETPSGGEIRVNDRVISSPQGVVPPERRDISLVFQNYAVWPHKTVAENVAFGLQIRKVPRADLEQKLKKALKTVHLDHLADRYPSELSGGQQQRVALARALIVEPSILLLDEPLSNLDAHLREEMRFEIRRVHDLLGLTTVYVTHDQGEALVTANQVAVMNGGSVQQLGSPREIFERPANAFVAAFIGSNNVIHARMTGAGTAQFGEQTLRGIDRSGARPGDEVTLCIRPSRVRVVGPGQGAENVLAGTVLRTAYLGEYCDVLVDIGNGASVRAFTAPHLDYQVGQVVLLQLPEDDCHLLQPGNRVTS